MKMNNRQKALLIFAIYLAATLALLAFGYAVQAPKVRQQEFPFTITYTYEGKTETISDIYVVEYSPDAQYIGESSISWFGYVKDKDRLELDYYTIFRAEDHAFSINLNMEPGYLMGEPGYADTVCEPSGAYTAYEEPTIEDAAELAQMGFTIDSWEYPAPIENSFSFGGFSLSSEATMYTAAIAAAALLACIIAIKRDREMKYGVLDKVSIVLNFLVAICAFPFILVASCLSEIVSDATFVQQLLYLSPALTALGIAASVTLRRMGRKQIGFWIQFVGPVVFVLTILL